MLPRACTVFTFCLALCQASYAVPAMAMEAQNEPPPRIGLALGGGGARGIAHVGVLRALEELRIPIHCIAGTSMGAVVGALYAVGLSPSEIETAVFGIDWRDIFLDAPQRTQRSYRRKQDDSADLFDFELGIRNGRLTLPRAFIAGQKLSFAFHVPELHTEGTRSFDSLRLPFRAVTTDVRTGDMVVLADGSLLHAVRASMAIPGAFTAAEIGDKLLLDGGLVRNVPVDVARAMGADVVIAVNVGEDLGARTPQELASPLEFSLQLISLIVAHNVNEVLPEADVVIHPGLPGIRLIDFSRAETIATMGAETTLRMASKLQTYSVSEADYAAYLKRQRRVTEPVVQLENIVVENRTRIDDRSVAARLRTSPGTPFDLKSVEADMNRLYDLGLVERADFDLPFAMGTPVDSNRTLRVHLREKTYGPSLLHSGLMFSSNLEGDARFSGRARLTTMELNARGAEWRQDFRLGTRSAAASEWYQPIDWSRCWFVAPKLEYRNDYEDVFTAGGIARYRFQEARAQVEAGRQLAYVGELRTGLYFGWGRSELKTPAGRRLPQQEGRLGGWTTRAAYDLVDDPDAPRSGSGAVLQATLDRHGLGSEFGFDRITGEWVGFATWRDNTGFVELETGSSLGSQLPLQALFRIGGLHSFSGFETGELTGEAFGVLRAGFSRPLTGDIDLVGTRVHVAAWFELGNAWVSTGAADLDELRYAGTLSLWANTLLGPLHLAQGWADGGHAMLYVSLGQQFGLSP